MIIFLYVFQVVPKIIEPGMDNVYLSAPGSSAAPSPSPELSLDVEHANNSEENEAIRSRVSLLMICIGL